MENVEGVAINQEEKPETHSGKVCDLQHIFDFSQQNIIKYDLQLNIDQNIYFSVP